ncbi:MAG: Asp-tRNA(Asn)/Glu-tRNA(Gln) amidotransferase subunit GatB [Planctomycetes bacterium]|nr:Asp-tRNA(Asn)/Glu-tRNA(Gln) amidotransferase subunit GatB [Planctomycetota bacterium]
MSHPLGEYELVIGLETHVQLKTATKLFCGCATRFGAEPNSQVCPICTGMPGMLPVLNRHAYELGVRAALALHCEIAPFTKFDRKNYFYPDLPKSYQISQFDVPISKNGWLEAAGEGHTVRVRIHRAHLEEDAGKLLHPESPVGRADYSLVDFNRSGVPLLEIVTEPDLTTPADAHAYLTELKQVLQYTGISDCDMEKGSLRCDANVSVRLRGATVLGTKTEIKNLNSFKFIVKALEHESERQIRVLEGGGRVVQETRLWDPVVGETRVMRSKEEAHDYRSFPDPDLQPFVITAEEVERIRRTLPEMPAARRRRFVESSGLTERDAEILTADRAIADYFEACAALHAAPKLLANWVIGELRKEMNERHLEAESLAEKLPPARLVELARLVEDGKITRLVGKDVLAEVLTSGAAAGRIVADKGLAQIADAGALEPLVDKVIAANGKTVADYRAGKKPALAALIGQVMRETKGKANAPLVTKLLQDRLGA